MTDNRYSKYLPEMIREYQAFQKLGELESVILEEEAAEKDALVRNQWILTAERKGLLRLAGMMKLSDAERMETEALREEILFRWNSRSPYTYFHLLDWLDGCCGQENYTIDLIKEEYLLKIVLELRIKGKKEFLEKHLRRIIPANLILRIFLHTNTHGKLKALTHGRMNQLGWTYGQIPFEDLTQYQWEKQ